MSTDLEVLQVPGEPVAGDSRGRPRPRWPWAVVVLVAIIAALAFPVRSSLAHEEFVRLESVWSAVLALDASRSVAIGRLANEAVASDAASVRSASEALYREESVHLTTISRRIPSHRSFDPGVGTLRGAIVRAIHLELADLAIMAMAESTQTGRLPLTLAESGGTVSAFRRVEDLLSSQGRFGEHGATFSASGTDLHAADAVLARFGHFADVATGARLLVQTNFGPRLLDVDRSTDESAPTPASATSVLVRDGFVFVADKGFVYRWTGDLLGPARPIGRGVTVLPGGRPDTIWLLDGAPLAPAREVTLDGAPLTGVIDVPGGAVGSVDAGLVYAANAAAGVMDPSGRPAVAFPVPLPLEVIAARGDQVAWVNPGLGVFGVSARAVHAIPLPPGYRTAEGAGAFSPDGRWLGVYLPADGQDVPAVVDLHTGAVHVLADGSTPFVGHLSMDWTPDSRRLFFTTGQDGATVAMWAPGDADATILRWRGASVASLVVLP